MSDNGQKRNAGLAPSRTGDLEHDNFVLEKNIFSNIFEKDIRRVYIYKKAERLAKAMYLITPAFNQSVSLKNRIESIAIGLIDAAVLPPTSAKNLLSKELLTLSSVLSIARTSGLLSAMNADMIAKEAQALLHEVASYEEPRLFLEQAQTLTDIARKVSHKRHAVVAKTAGASFSKENESPETSKGVTKEKDRSDRKERLITALKTKGQVSIKDISVAIRDVSEKTIQRELQSLVEEGMVKKAGERRWSTYSLI